MDNKEIEKKVREVLSRRLGFKGLIEDDTGSEDIPGWDSLNHVLLISDIEKEFSIRFSLDELLEMQSFGEICRKVENYLN